VKGLYTTFYYGFFTLKSCLSSIFGCIHLEDWHGTTTEDALVNGNQLNWLFKIGKVLFDHDEKPFYLP